MAQSKSSKKFNFGTVMHILYLFGTVMVITAIARLVIWSYGETLKLSGGVTGMEFRGNLAMIVQLGPLVFLLARRVFKDHGVMPQAATILFWLAILFNLADWLTNELAYAIGGYVLPSELLIGFNVATIPENAQWAIKGGTIFGHFVCALVTWGEEGIIWLIALGGHFIYLISLDLGGNPPLWMSITHSLGSGQQPQLKQQPANGSQPQREPQPPPVRVTPSNGNGQRIRQRPPVPPRGLHS